MQNRNDELAISLIKKLEAVNNLSDITRDDTISEQEKIEIIGQRNIQSELEEAVTLVSKNSAILEKVGVDKDLTMRFYLQSANIFRNAVRYQILLLTQNANYSKEKAFEIINLWKSISFYLNKGKSLVQNNLYFLQRTFDFTASIDRLKNDLYKFGIMVEGNHSPLTESKTEATSNKDTRTFTLTNTPKLYQMLPPKKVSPAEMKSRKRKREQIQMNKEVMPVNKLDVLFDIAKTNLFKP